MILNSKAFEIHTKPKTVTRWGIAVLLCLDGG